MQPQLLPRLTLTEGVLPTGANLRSIEPSRLVPPNAERSFRHREIVPLIPSRLWKIESGFVRTLTWDMTGGVTTLGIWGTGDIIGKPLSQLDPYQIECLTAVQVSEVVLSRHHLTDLMFRHVQHLEVLVNILHTKQIVSRLLKLLEWLAQRFGDEVEQGRVIEMRLTHQVMAEMIGTTRVTVTRLLKDLEHQGKLTPLRKHRILLHYSDLRRC
ncbi:Crp/Fnr family transcriptional regulator [Phormidesmis priestleyi]